jgi:hypothetical protein
MFFSIEFGLGALEHGIEKEKIILFSCKFRSLIMFNFIKIKPSLLTELFL